MATPTPLESCRTLVARISDALNDRAALAAIYVDTIGYDPFAEDPEADPADVLAILQDYAREWAAASGVHWSLVVAP